VAKVGATMQPASSRAMSPATMRAHTAAPREAPQAASCGRTPNKQNGTQPTCTAPQTSSKGGSVPVSS